MQKSGYEDAFWQKLRPFGSRQMKEEALDVERLNEYTNHYDC